MVRFFCQVEGVAGRTGELTVRPLGTWKGSVSNLRSYDSGGQEGGAVGSLGTPGGRPSQAKRRAGISVVVVEGGCLWSHGGQCGQSPEERGATGFKAGGQGPVYGRARVGVGAAGGWAGQNGIREVMLEGPGWGMG